MGQVETDDHDDLDDLDDPKVIVVIEVIVVIVFEWPLFHFFSIFIFGKIRVLSYYCTLHIIYVVN